MTFPITLADQNLAESLREFTRWSAEGQISEQDGLLLTLGADPFPAINDVMRASDRSSPAAPELLDRACDYFASKQRGFGIRARAHLDEDLIALCKARRLFQLSNSPGLGIRAPIDERTLPTLPATQNQLDLRTISDAAGAADFALVCTAAYGTMGLPAASAGKLFSRVERALQPHIKIVVAYDAGQPLSAALAFLSHGIGGIYWVGTVPTARKRGVAAHCTRAVTNWCFEQGASAVALQASQQGEPIYRALGFTEFTRYPWFLCNPLPQGAAR
jgi:GNAT superfamily N-acetyltransferase